MSWASISHTTTSTTSVALPLPVSHVEGPAESFDIGYCRKLKFTPYLVSAHSSSLW